MRRSPIALSVCLMSAGFLSAALFARAAQAEDMTLDDLSVVTTKGRVVFPHVTFSGSNLSADDAKALFAEQTPPDQRKALFVKLKAAKVSIPEAQYSSTAGQAALHNLVVDDIEGGKAAKLTVDSADGSWTRPADKPATGRSGSLALDNVDITSILDAPTLFAAGFALRATHVSWAGFTITAADPHTPASAVGGDLWRIQLGSMTADAAYQGAVPLTSTSTFQHLTVKPPPDSPFGKTLNSLGYEQTDMDLSASGRYDPASKSYSLDKFLLDANGMATATLSATLGGVTDGLFAAAPEPRRAAMAASELQTAKAIVVDHGLFNKVLEWYAAQEDQPADDLRREWTAMAAELIPVLLRGTPASLPLAQAVSAFVAKPGTLNLALKAKGDGVPLGDLRRRQSRELLPLFDVTATASP